MMSFNREATSIARASPPETLPATLNDTMPPKALICLAAISCQDG